jgi:NADPH-dependent 2,4-dienoyl-CoA reductase/sulfur reductase-like enzyme
MTRRIGIVGGGPAGLMAAEALSARGHAVTVLEAMPTIGRKFLLAGKSGLNLTHSEPYARFSSRFGAASDRLRNLRRHVRPGVSHRDEGIAAAPRLAGAAGKSGCRDPRAPSLDGVFA